MAIKKYKPTSAGMRGMSVLDYSELSKVKPEKSLTESLKRKGGRNSRGIITVRHRGGGAAKRYRIIDFKRNKDGIPAKAWNVPARSRYELVSSRRTRKG